MDRYEIHLLPALSDNYIPVITDSSTRSAIVIDPACAQTVKNFLEQNSLSLSYILNTHHHQDHVEGNLELVDSFPKSEIIGYEDDQHRIPGIHRTCRHQDQIELLSLQIQVLFVPGHTLGHCAYYSPQLKSLFSGDVIFSCGCGRIFEGSPEQMWESLCQLRQLPDETLIYCAHEYTLNNVNFALSIFPNDKELKNFQKKVDKLRNNQKATIPTTIGQEKKINPFLRSDFPEVASALKMPSETALNIFSHLKKLKDQY